MLGLIALFVSPRRIAKVAALVKPSTLLRFHKALVERKYRRLFSSAAARAKAKPGPKGPAEELIATIIEMKLRTPSFGYQRIAQQIAHAFGVQIDKDVVRRALARHYGPRHRGSMGPSWLTFLAQSKDSLWSVDLFRSHWVLVVMDVFTRRIVGFGIAGEYVDGPSLCRMFNQAIERLIGTIRREYLDRTFFWNSVDLHQKLTDFQNYYNQARCHRALDGPTRAEHAHGPPTPRAKLTSYLWERHCRGLFEVPIAA